MGYCLLQIPGLWETWNVAANAAKKPRTATAVATFAPGNVATTFYHVPGGQPRIWETDKTEISSYSQWSQEGLRILQKDICLAVCLKMSLARIVCGSTRKSTRYFKKRNFGVQKVKYQNPKGGKAPTVRDFVNISNFDLPLEKYTVEPFLFYIMQ